MALWSARSIDSKPGNDPPAVQWLVIGYGNTLRGDDGVGYQVAETVATWGLQGVTALSCHQLLPELAAELARAQQVLFVDAEIAPATAQPNAAITSLPLDNTVTFTTHTATPASLLALAQWLYGATPVAYQLTIPAIAFDLGETFSPVTSASQSLALERIYTWLTPTKAPPGSQPPSPCSPSFPRKSLSSPAV
jgi:hydrogenase maturation protease